MDGGGKSRTTAPRMDFRGIRLSCVNVQPSVLTHVSGGEATRFGVTRDWRNTRSIGGPVASVLHILSWRVRCRVQVSTRPANLRIAIFPMRQNNAERERPCHTIASSTITMRRDRSFSIYNRTIGQRKEQQKNAVGEALGAYEAIACLRVKRLPLGSHMLDIRVKRLPLASHVLG